MSTVRMNRFGHLEVWEGEKKGEAELYLQAQDDVDEFLKHLTEDEVEAIERGWQITTNHVPEDYFSQEYKGCSPLETQ